MKEKLIKENDLYSTEVNYRKGNEDDQQDEVDEVRDKTGTNQYDERGEDEQLDEMMAWLEENQKNKNKNDYQRRQFGN